MLKKEYFLQSLRANAHYSREWVLRAFSTVISPGTDTPYTLRHTKDAVEVYIPTDSSGEWVVLTDAIPYDIPFIYHDHCGMLYKGDIANIDGDIPDSTWGDLLINARVLVYACGDRIPYMVGPFSPGDIEKIFIKEMQDNPPFGIEPDPNVLYVSHWLKVGKAVGDLDGLEIFIPSITEHALQPYPGLEEDRARLLAMYTPSELRDPVIQVKIQNELVAKYKEYLKGDPSEGFIFKDKFVSTSLKQMFLIHGPEAGFSEGGQATLITSSLDEGLDVKYFPEMMNSQRAGAYFRGAMTALAGTDVDLIGRIFQNTRISDKFCGTKDVLLNVPVVKNLLERWMLIEGNRVQLTEDNLKDYLSTRQSFYDPSFCKTGDNDVCHICIGGRLAKYPTSLGSGVAGKQSVLMSVMMASAHAKTLTTVPLKQDWLE